MIAKSVESMKESVKGVNKLKLVSKIHGSMMKKIDIINKNKEMIYTDNQEVREK